MAGKKILINLLLVALSFQCAQCSSCGKSLEKNLQTRIISGYDIGYYKYPWLGIIKQNNALKCTCTMINEQFALTVASCFKEYLPVKPDHNITGVYTVTLGAYNRCNTNETTQKTFSVQTIYIHSGFDVTKRANNIALIKLSEATTFEPVCLPSAPISESQRSTEGIITGAGLINYDQQQKTCYINEARVLIYTNDYCNKSLAAIGEDTTLIDKNFCAGGAKETKPYGCGSDLGGPLISQDNTTTKYILGLISYKKCPDNDNITLYVDVSAYLVWIHSVINSTTPEPPATPTSTPTPTPTQSPSPSTTEDYDYIEHFPTTTTTTTTSTTTTPGSLIIGGSKRKGHSDRHGHKKHGEHLKREAQHEPHKKHHGKHENKHHKKHHHEEHEIDDKKH
nr:acrosin-like isoform X2 [Onthophagus taurus]